MTRTIRLFLSVCVICGILSLGIFYLYTNRFNNRQFDINTPRTKKTDLTEGKTKILSDEDLLSTVKPVTSHSSPVATQKPSGISGDDSTDEPSETDKLKLVKNATPSHPDGDEPGPSKLPGNEQEKSTPRTTFAVTSKLSSKPTVKPTTQTILREKSTPAETHSSDDAEDENLEFCAEKPPSLSKF